MSTETCHIEPHDRNMVLLYEAELKLRPLLSSPTARSETYQIASWRRWRTNQIAKYGEGAIANLFPKELDGYHSPITESMHKLEKLGITSKEELLVTQFDNLKTRLKIDPSEILLFKTIQEAALAEYHLKWSSNRSSFQ